MVYNHVGPEGNYLSEFGPYYTNAYRTPWGDAINFDGPESDGVRRFFVENALYWLTEYHIDGLRLDAIHGIFDFGARHILRELADAFHAQAEKLGRSAWLIAESDLNDSRVIEPPAQGGYGIDAQWLDDFHHALHTSLTGENRAYFADFNGLQSLQKALVNGYVYEGQYSRYRRRRHGSSSKGRPGKRFVAFTQNHDQIANALQGSRSSRVLSLEQQKLAAAVLFFSPYLPLLFMGQEYGEKAEFLYFTEHGDAALIEAVREGRRNEVNEFSTGGEFVDPQDVDTFNARNWTGASASSLRTQVCSTFIAIGSGCENGTPPCATAASRWCARDAMRRIDGWCRSGAIFRDRARCWSAISRGRRARCRLPSAALHGECACGAATRDMVRRLPLQRPG